MKTKIDLDEFGLDPDQCCYCTSASVFTDRYDLPWCEEHKHRGRLLNWGLQHGWPELACFPYAIGRGEYCWYTAVVAGIDALIWMALAAIEHMESVVAAASAQLTEEVQESSSPKQSLA